MILTAAFLICKALGVTWSWWWLMVTVIVDYSFRDNLIIKMTRQ